MIDSWKNINKARGSMDIVDQSDEAIELARKMEKEAAKLFDEVEEFNKVSLKNVDPDELNVGKALDPGQPFDVSNPKVSKIPTRRTTDDVPRFSDISPKIKLKTYKNLIGQPLSSDLQSIWEIAKSKSKTKIQIEVSEVQKLLLTNRIEEAKELARNIYNKQRNRFWTEVKQHTGVVTMLEDCGLNFKRKSNGALIIDKTAPYWVWPDGYKEALTIDHITRVTDNPLLMVDASNMRIVPLRENCNTLEYIRNKDLFQ